jgi:hypothetical protein
MTKAEGFYEPHIGYISPDKHNIKDAIFQMNVLAFKHSQEKIWSTN